MGTLFFSAGDIFEIAIQIERNGAKFYREAAGQVSGDDVKRELLDLAAMEDTHEITFIELKRDLVGNDEAPDWFEPEDEAVLYLQTFAQGQIFDLTKSGPIIAADTPLDQIIEWALERERESIVFYLGIKELVPPSLGGGRIEPIIKQEMSHVAQLSRRLMEIAH